MKIRAPVPWERERGMSAEQRSGVLDVTPYRAPLARRPVRRIEFETG